MEKRGKIVAIGGGEMGRPGYPVETTAIDKEIIRLTGKRHPNALLLPTASADSETYYPTFEKQYGKRLGCKTDVLYLIKEKHSKKEIERKIFGFDIVYVGGGNTLKMLNIWKRIGFDKILKKAHDRGIVLCGVSAGAICWFGYGHSDSMSFYNPKKWDYIRLKCLNYVKCIACPHYDGADRRKEFRKMIKKIGGVGIGIDNCCAMEFVDNKYRVIISKKGANAYKVYNRKGKVVEERIDQKKEFASISELFKKNL